MEAFSELESAQAILDNCEYASEEYYEALKSIKVGTSRTPTHRPE